jgi:hypothetical protein
MRLKNGYDEPLTWLDHIEIMNFIYYPLSQHAIYSYLSRVLIATHHKNGAKESKRSIGSQLRREVLVKVTVGK